MDMQQPDDRGPDEGERPFPPQYLNPRSHFRLVLIALWVAVGLLLVVVAVLIVTGR